MLVRSRAGIQDVIIVHLAGEFDLSRWAELEALLMNTVESNRASPIVLDLSNVSFIDAHSIGLIVAASTAVSSDGRGLRVRGLHGLPERLFRLLGLEELLTDHAADVYPGVQIGGPHGTTANVSEGSGFGGRAHATG